MCHFQANTKEIGTNSSYIFYLRHYISIFIIYADLFNAIIYNGEDIIKPTDLTPQSNESGFLSEDKNKKRKALDIIVSDLDDDLENIEPIYDAII